MIIGTDEEATGMIIAAVKLALSARATLKAGVAPNRVLEILKQTPTVAFSQEASKRIVAEVLEDLKNE